MVNLYIFFVWIFIIACSNYICLETWSVKRDRALSLLEKRKKNMASTIQFSSGWNRYIYYKCIFQLHSQLLLFNILAYFIVYRLYTSYTTQHATSSWLYLLRLKILLALEYLVHDQSLYTSRTYWRLLQTIEFYGHHVYITEWSIAVKFIPSKKYCTRAELTVHGRSGLGYCSRLMGFQSSTFYECCPCPLWQFSD